MLKNIFIICSPPKPGYVKGFSLEKDDLGKDSIEIVVFRPEIVNFQPSPLIARAIIIHELGHAILKMDNEIEVDEMAKKKWCFKHEIDALTSWRKKYKGGTYGNFS